MNWMVVLGLALVLAAPASGVGEDCRTARRLGRSSESNSCFLKLAGSADPFARAEGLWGMERFEDAKRQFELALKRDPRNPAIPTRYGRMLLERFNKDQSMELFEQALAIEKEYPPALVGIALIAGESFDRKSVDLAEQAAKKDPALLEARELLARFVLEDGNHSRAREEAQEALKISGQSMDAMAILAAADLLEDKTDSPWMSRAYAVNPKYAMAPTIVARLLVLNRRYQDAILYYRKAVELDPNLYAAKSELGVQSMRVGEPKEAHELLSECYSNGYKNAATANSLKLLDSYKNFVTYKTSHGSVMLHRKEAEVLRPYLENEIRRAVTAYERKYQMKAPGSITVELYPDHEDFAVRALGLPGLGALGVTFGASIAMDSPSGRPPGSFHWGSTLWHELSHVFVIAATNNRTPRWFTEGVAVHEETLVSPEWGDRLDPQVIAAIKQKKLLPIATLDRGFMRPSYPGQVVVSYFQAGRICDYISTKWGEAKINELIKAFSKVETTSQVIENVLGMKPEEFDKQFLAWLNEQHKQPLEKFDEWSKRLKGMMAASRKKDYAEVIREGKEILPWYSEYVEPGSAYEMLAEAYEASGQTTEAREVLSSYAKAGGRNPVTLKKLATLEEKAGRPKEAAAALARINYVAPVGDEELHKQLGTLYADLKDWNGAVLEFRAWAGSKPADPAAANFNLARAYHALGRRAEAEESLLAALESAPGYKPAQRLLLELNRSSESPRKQ